jgi:hypothetical protein
MDGLDRPHRLTRSHHHVQLQQDQRRGCLLDGHLPPRYGPGSGACPRGGVRPGQSPRFCPRQGGIDGRAGYVNETDNRVQRNRSRRPSRPRPRATRLPPPPPPPPPRAGTPDDHKTTRRRDGGSTTTPGRTTDPPHTYIYIHPPNSNGGATLLTGVTSYIGSSLATLSGWARTATRAVSAMVDYLKADLVQAAVAGACYAAAVYTGKLNKWSCTMHDVYTCITYIRRQPGSMHIHHKSTGGDMAPNAHVAYGIFSGIAEGTLVRSAYIRMDG